MSVLIKTTNDTVPAVEIPYIGDSSSPSYKNLVIKNNTGTPNSQIDISWDNLQIGRIHSAPSGGYSQTLDIESNGDWDSGDAGDEPVNGWVYIYAFANTSASEICKFSLSTTAPTPPTGYIFSKLVGSVRNTSGDFVSFYQIDDYVRKAASLHSAITTTDSGTARDISVFVPSLVKSIKVQLSMAFTVSGTYTSGTFTVYGGGDNLGDYFVVQESNSETQTLTKSVYETSILKMRDSNIFTVAGAATGTFSCATFLFGYYINI